MKIKSTKNSSGLKSILWVTGLLVFVSLAFYLPKQIKRASPKPLSLNATPDSVLQFVEERHNIFEVLDYFENYDVFLSVKYDAAKKMPDTLRQYLIQNGSKDISRLGIQDSYVAAIKNGQIVKEKLRGKSPASIRHKGYKVTSGGQRVGDFSRIERKGSKIESPNAGLNVYICNPKNWTIFNYAFAYFEEENPTSRGQHGKVKIKDLETIEISLSTKSYQQLKEKRKAALQSGVLITEEDDFVPADLRHNNQDYQATLRLKGDWTDHLNSEKWSFRIKIENDQTLTGMRKFSLHHPHTRNYAGEWIFHQLLEEAGILNLQYRFVQVQLNVPGMSEQEGFLGIYALEEAFDKHLVERNQKREGVILKFDEDPIWQERATYLQNDLNLEDLEFTSITDYPNLDILPFGEKKTLSDSTLSKHFKTARGLFLGYLNKELPISEVFNVELLAKYNALCNYLGGDHALIPHNYRAYYNPVTSKLEPIGFDANAIHKTWFFSFYMHAKDDPVFMEAYGKAMEEITARDYLYRILDDPLLKEKVELLQKEFGDYSWDPQILKHNRHIMRLALYPKRCLNVFLEKFEQDKIRLSIENYGKFPVEILGLQKIDAKIFGQPQEKTIIWPNKRETITIPLEADYQRLFVSKKQQKTQFSIQEDIQKVQLLWKTLGTSLIQEVSITPWEQRVALTAENDLFRKKPNAVEFDFLVFDETKKTITLQPGDWVLQKDLIIPKGYTFLAGPGCSIEMRNHQAKIISFSPLHFVGSPDNPIEIKSPTKKGQGILVLETQDTSIINYCNFTNLSNPSTPTWVITGAVNFYDAPVKIFNSIFADNHSEDALNIIRSSFEMDNVVFSNIQSDAFDGDFVKGTIRNCTFGKMGNDAIDVSGSEIFVENTDILEAGDKGLSAGEATILKAKNVSIVDSEIAVASKDQSELIVENLILRNNKLGFTAFQKKPEFGPSIIQAREVQLKNNELNYLIEQNSSLELNGQKVETSNLVMERLYGAEFGKSSK